MKTTDSNILSSSRRNSTAVDNIGQVVCLNGAVSHIRFRNEENGFSVLTLTVDSSSQVSTNRSITVVGILPDGVSIGSVIKVQGQWDTHPRFGRQLKASLIMEEQPTTAAAIERYLAGNSVKGFGPVLAKRVVEHFGSNALEIIDNEPERLLEVSGIGREKLRLITEQWGTNKLERDILTFLYGYGISHGIARRIYKHYGGNAVAVLKRNPYLLAKTIWGIGFKTADEIAQSIGIAKDSEVRIRAGFVYGLNKALESGHCYYPRDELLLKTATLLGLDCPERLEAILGDSIVNNEIVKIDGRIYLPELNEAERHLAELVSQFLMASSAPLANIAAEELDSVASRAFVGANAARGGEAHSGIIRLSAKQRLGLELAVTHSLLVITGGPGCGKTTLVRALVSLFQRAKLGIKLAAPTGRAAQRLSEVCDMGASTIHRLLRYNPYTNSFTHDENQPLETDVIIVDECSMVDVPLALSLFRAIRAGTRIIIVGDADQLPSVGPGLFLRDLLSIQEVSRVELSSVFRQKVHSSIIEIAHRINSSIIPKIPTYSAEDKRADAYLCPIKDAKSGADVIERLVVDDVPRIFNYSPEDVIVLSPMNRGDLGIESLNCRLQNRLVPATEETPRVRVGRLEFRVGDKVCQRVNNYSIAPGGVFNGDRGEVIGIDAFARSVFVRLWDGREVTYQSTNLSELDLAYAITIHRAQGSEMPVVVLAIHESHIVLLERQLLYTAVTRAKQLLIIVGTHKALAMATKKTQSKRRYTTLADRVLEELRKPAKLIN
ncbi:MAG: ATP-dependent RecD-like DNA helicase [Deltaproteobacteria bacterium]|nr:ATP-dependent RecD-like DNA helicase [Deltaproteobacteria bacterium]